MDKLEQRISKTSLCLGMIVLLLVSGLFIPIPSQAGITTRISVASDRTQADGVSNTPSISADGRYVAFASSAYNLVPGDTLSQTDIFIYDRQTGQTTRVSVASDGTEGNSASIKPSISADGRAVAFSSTAYNLVAGDTNGVSDVFVHDRQTGQTTRVSVASGGIQKNKQSSLPSLSADGRFVAFSSGDWFSADPNDRSNIFVHDRQTGETTLVTTDSSIYPTNIYRFNAPSLSADGRYVAFVGVAGGAAIATEIYVHDRQTGVSTRVSPAWDDGGSTTYSMSPSISADGRFVAFQSGLVEYTYFNILGDIFLHDRQTGVTTQVTSGSHIFPTIRSISPSISADGRFVTFASNANDLVPGDTNDQSDIFIYDRQAGQTARVSVASDGTQANGSNTPSIDMEGNTLSISADGRFVSFASNASNLAPGDTNGQTDIFVHDTGFSTDASASTKVTLHSATLNGTVNPQGLETTCYFEWGTTMAYGNSTPSQSAGSGTIDVAVSAEVNGLTSNTAYHFRLVAVNTAGTRFGSDQAFTTRSKNFDFNGDGMADIFWQHQPTGMLYTWFMDGLDALALGSPGTVDPGSGWQIKGVADFNGDGNADILWRHQPTGMLYTWLMNGLTFLSGGYPGTVSDPDWEIAALADFNGDGRADILWRHKPTGMLYIWFMDGLGVVSRGSPGTVDPGSGWQIKGVADFNEDGKADILWQHEPTGMPYTWLMNGLALLSVGYPGTVSDPHWEIIGLADFSGDGKADILWRHAPSGMLYTWFMDSLDVVASGSPGSADLSWALKGVRDFNGDGKADILWQDQLTGKLYLWPMNGVTIDSAGSLGAVSGDWTLKF